MSNTSMTPGSRPRKGVIAGAAVATSLIVMALALAAGEAASPPRAAGASELVTFSSCEDMAAWGRRAQQEGMEENLNLVGGDMDAAAEAPPAGRATADSDNGASGSSATASGEVAPADATNVAVEGVDELDLIDHLGEDRVLVASASRLAIVDLAGADVLASRPVSYGAQITYDAESGVAWVVGYDEGLGNVTYEGQGNVTVDRVTVTDDALTTDGTWTTSGSLVDARRVGAELHVVATEGFAVRPVPGADMGGFSNRNVGAVSLPFADGPVPCDEVLHPTGPTDPMATLIVTLPATGAVEPVRATEVVGSGEQVHVTPDAAYLATTEYADDTVSTGLHRFDLATLTPTGSGRVEGRLLNEFSLSEADGHLRVAVTTGPDVMVATPRMEGPADDMVLPTPPPIEGEARNEVVVLDTDGDLDVVGRTPRFGKPGESIHGIRFAGPVAYAVTFLTTDPFYVIDLATPTEPRILGEVELPGFSSYLHPLSDGLVVGFGPGDDGRATAKLFDVSDPSAPRVADSLGLGDESAVTSDHHAFVDLGDGRFAVPASTWSGEAGADSSVVVVDTRDGELTEESRQSVTTGQPVTRAIPAGDGWALLAGDQIVVLDDAGAVRATLGLT